MGNSTTDSLPKSSDAKTVENALDALSGGVSRNPRKFRHPYSNTITFYRLTVTGEKLLRGLLQRNFNIHPSSGSQVN